MSGLIKDFPKYVSCINAAHTFGIIPESAAAARFIRAQHIGPEDCPVCNEDARERFQRDARMCDCSDEICAMQCAYMQDLNKIEDPPPGLVYIPPDSRY